MNVSKLFNGKLATKEQITCPYCEEHKSLDEYHDYKCPDGIKDNLEILREIENTFCEYSGCFTCNECYVKIGMPMEEELKHNAYLVFRLRIESLPHQNNNAIAEALY